ncbi:DUF397 domain-containing protein [Amycolatopsis australiensis]|uniref:DUF397 domain-containing protein n=1 Tax=Amycolatopsis australiensis TaxID=546364 RepID=A0A1K1PFF1_9PSEU|nr:DUF397 domain-containing protein [Amycolatopsis australiensis]SFW45406.1 protein of unknown function [Amycolatopsis australiensis]
MRPQQLTGWHKSSHSHFEENACVEVGTGPGVVGVRDTKQPEPRPILTCSTTAFAAFLDHLTGGR